MTSDVLQAAEDDPVVIADVERSTLVLVSMQEYDRLWGRHQTAGCSVELPDHLADDEIEGLAGSKP